MGNKASREYWDEIYEKMQVEIIPEADIVRQWFERYIPAVSPDSGKTCIEIGCYPGRYLAVFGERGYVLYGIDNCKKLQLLPGSLKDLGYRVGTFWNEDFFAFTPGMKFDVVSSFGFIEHFTNYLEVLEKHLALVKDGGYLVLTVPNFYGGFQNWLHRNFDRLNYSRHFIPAMDIKSWNSVLPREGFREVYSGYFGEFTYWTEADKRGLWSRGVLKILGKLSPYLKRVLPADKRLYSPYGGIILHKP